MSVDYSLVQFVAALRSITATVADEPNILRHASLVVFCDRVIGSAHLHGHAAF